MLVKLGIAAAVLAYAGVSLAAVDYRELYNEMYPANGLKRGVLGLCQASKPTFVRAIEQDRIDCYDSMPSAIERAIGWVRTSARLAAMKTPTGVELAEKLMQQAELRQPFGPLRFAAATASTGSDSAACEPAVARSPAAAPAPRMLAAVEPSGELARRIASGDEKLLREIGLGKPDQHAGAKQPSDLPVLPLNGSSPPATAGTASAAAGETGALLGGGCRTPA